MRYGLLALALFLLGCGADVQYGGMRHDEAMTAPEGGHATYIDPPNFPRGDTMFDAGPEPAAAQIPPGELSNETR